MQAPLSISASGKSYRSGPYTATLTAPFSAVSNISVSKASAAQLVVSDFEGSVGHRFDGLPGDAVAEGAGLAHDAGNLFGALGLYCDLLARPGVLREEHRHYADELRMLSGRSRELIDRLLQPQPLGTPQGIARVLQMDRTSQNRLLLPEVIEGCRGLLDKVARRAVEISYGGEAMVPVAVEREALERILVNLTKNAAEASPQGGTINLRVSCLRDGTDSGERVVLTVQDHGCGMSSSAVKVLLEGKVKRSPNRGIGFRVVRELVSASGGRLYLTSSLGCGTSVSVAWGVAPAGLDHEIGRDGSHMVGFPQTKRRETGSQTAVGRFSC